MSCALAAADAGAAPPPSGAACDFVPPPQAPIETAAPIAKLR